MRHASGCQALPPVSQEYTDSSYYYETCEQAPSTAPAIPGVHKGHCTCTPHIKGITASTR